MQAVFLSLPGFRLESGRGNDRPQTGHFPGNRPGVEQSVPSGGALRDPGAGPRDLPELRLARAERRRHTISETPGVSKNLVTACAPGQPAACRDPSRNLEIGGQEVPGDPLGLIQLSLVTMKAAMSFNSDASSPSPDRLSVASLYRSSARALDSARPRIAG